MQIREALAADIPQIQIVRHSVKENILSNPALVTDQDCKEYLTVRGKGWVYESDDQIVAFAIADLEDHKIWALFVMPQYAGKGIGKKLHDIMLNWYFQQTKKTVWLSTGCNTRAETFYRMQGWKDIGTYSLKEIRFEMTFGEWKVRK